MKKNNFEGKEINNLPIETSQANQIAAENPPNTEFFYRGNDIVKIWEQCLKSIDQQIKFYCKDHRNNVETISSIFNDLTQSKEACLVIKADESLYINKNDQSISLCGEIDYKNAKEGSNNNKSIARLHAYV